MFQYHKINASQYDIIAPGDMRIAIAGTEKDARRIVACLNALTELDTEYIEKWRFGMFRPSTPGFWRH